MDRKKILVIEDDKHISRLIKYNLDRAGFDCLSRITGEDGLELVREEDIELIILDIMLPRMDGLDFCRQVRSDKRHASIPIVMLTAKGEEIDRIVGLELGADDYIVKPFSPRELVLRVKAILKRGRPAEAAKDIMSAGKLKVNVSRHAVTVEGRKVALTMLEFKLLVTLMQRKGRVQSRDRLLNDVWDMASEVTTRTIDTHIKRLRQKLGQSGALIETVRGLGYRFSDEDENG